MCDQPADTDGEGSNTPRGQQRFTPHAVGIAMPCQVIGCNANPLQATVALSGTSSASTAILRQAIRNGRGFCKVRNPDLNANTFC